MTLTKNYLFLGILLLGAFSLAGCSGGSSSDWRTPACRKPGSSSVNPPFLAGARRSPPVDHERERFWRPRCRYDKRGRQRPPDDRDGSHDNDHRSPRAGRCPGGERQHRHHPGKFRQRGLERSRWQHAEPGAGELIFGGQSLFQCPHVCESQRRDPRTDRWGRGCSRRDAVRPVSTSLNKPYPPGRVAYRLPCIEVNNFPRKRIAPRLRIKQSQSNNDLAFPFSDVLFE